MLIWRQSSAAQGDKDILITYSDADAAPAHPAHMAHRPTQKRLVEHTTGEHNHGGPGIILTNKSNKSCTYYFYDNFWYPLPRPSFPPPNQLPPYLQN